MSRFVHIKANVKHIQLLPGHHAIILHMAASICVPRAYRFQVSQVLARTDRRIVYTQQLKNLLPSLAFSSISTPKHPIIRDPNKPPTHAATELRDHSAQAAAVIDLERSLAVRCQHMFDHGKPHTWFFSCDNAPSPESWCPPRSSSWSVAVAHVTLHLTHRIADLEAFVSQHLDNEADTCSGPVALAAFTAIVAKCILDLC